MQDVTTAIARVMAVEAGARFRVIPGVVYDTTDHELSVMAGALLEKCESTGIDLLSLRREGCTLVAHINEDLADEPLCPAAFTWVVRKLSHDLLGEVWEGRFTVAPTSTTAPAHTALSRVA